MSETKEISEKDVKDLIKNLLDVIAPIVEKASGEKVPRKIPKNKIRQVKSAIEYFQDVAQRTDAVKKREDIPDKEKKEQEMQLLDELLGTMFGIEGDNPVENITERLNPKLSYEKRIPDKKYREKIRTTIWEILYEIDRQKKLKLLEDFLQSIGLDNFFANSQSAQRLNLKIPYIMKDRKRITRTIAERYLDSYKEVAGFLESLIVILYGFLCILRGKYKTYPDLRKEPIGKLVNLLKKEEKFNILIEPYDTRIRNSIVHVSYHIDSMARKIEFMDRDKKFSKTFEEFVEYVKEITRRAIILCHMEEEINYLKFRAYSNLRKK